MAEWVVVYADAALKQMKKIDKHTQMRIRRYLAEKIHYTADPRRLGKALTGDKAGLWRYRVGDYRLICHLEEHCLTVLVVTVGHRKEVYQ